MSNGAGKLYVVATPIGNLDDISPRALRILGQVDFIAAEDTRHSSRLLQHYAINRPLRSCHDFNEQQSGKDLLARLQSGASVALISDAGTPLLSDPGYRLLQQACEHRVEVIAVPGPSALTAALSVAGLPTDRFVFEGFAPATRTRRQRWLESVRDESRTLVFYETPHRIRACLADAAELLGPGRDAVLARELTKQYESVYRGAVQELRQRVEAGEIPEKGEFVVLVHGAAPRDAGRDDDSERLLTVLLEELPLKQAASIAARITGARKNDLYALALKLTEGG